MALIRAIRSRLQRQNAPASNLQQSQRLEQSGSLPVRAIATISAGLLVIASAGFGVVFAAAQGAYHGPVLAAFAVAMALGLELAKPFAVEAIFASLRRWAIGRALAMALMATVCVGFSLTSELSLLAMTRGDAAAGRAKVADSAKDDRAELARIVAERSAMRFTPATADTVTAARDAVAAAERTRAAECGKRGPNCRAREADEAATRAMLAKAIADKAVTDRASKLDADAARVRARLARAPATAAADPGAMALAAYLALFGISVPAALLGEWLVLVGVVALEAGSALSLVMVRTIGGRQPPQSTGSQAVQAVPEPGAQPSDRPQTQFPDAKTGQKPDGDGPKRGRKAKRKPAGKRAKDRTRKLSNVVKLVRRSGGHVKASNRELGRRLGLSKSRTHEIVREAVAAGLLTAESSRAGTRLAVAG